MHTPVEVTEEALAATRAAGADALVALGGGSTIGLAKAIALRTDMPQIVDPDHLCRLRDDDNPWRNERRQEDHAENR